MRPHEGVLFVCHLLSVTRHSRSDNPAGFAKGNHRIYAGIGCRPIHGRRSVEAVIAIIIPVQAHCSLPFAVPP